MLFNTIIVGDCALVMAEWEPGIIDLTVTSPPYDNLRDYEGYHFDFEAIAQQLFRVTKQGGVVVWVVADETKDYCETLTSAKQKIYFVEQVGFKLLDTMFYEKLSYPPAYPSLMRYASVVEYMFILSKGKPNTFNELREPKTMSSLARQRNKHNGGYRQKDGSIKVGGGLSAKTDKARTNLWKYKPGGNYTNDRLALSHPAVFPEALANDHILSWSNPGDLVLDPMCGSGTTLKMAKQTGRNYIGIDMSENYCKLSEKRVKQVQTPLPPEFWQFDITREQQEEHSCQLSLELLRKRDV